MFLNTVVCWLKRKQINILKLEVWKSLSFGFFSLCTQSLIDPQAQCVIVRYFFFLSSAVTSLLPDVVTETSCRLHLPVYQVALLGVEFRDGTLAFPKNIVFKRLHGFSQAAYSKKKKIHREEPFWIVRFRSSCIQWKCQLHVHARRNRTNTFVLNFVFV